jgi:glycosyltransferase involved in cell wall biosynthesis
MLEAAGSGVVPDVVLRNTWPPRVDDMTGRLRGLVCYAWEETGFPLDDVHAFNSNLQFITVTSRFVAKTLRDNGIHVPIYVIGNGIDQIARLKEPSAIDLIREKFAIEDKFCFLHISTCLPRKGVDVLLAAWARAFSRDDDVILVIKGTDSSHFRHVEGLVAALRATQPRHAPVVLIKDDLSNADLAALYHIADVVASPSRGEGFGLPLAEAFAIGKPVITTAFGGQMDFCSSDNAWLCDYDFAYAQSYVSVPGSVWAEPRVDSLVDCMRRARSATALERSNRGELGRTAIETQYSWKSVAQRLRCLVAHARGQMHQMQNVQSLHLFHHGILLPALPNTATYWYLAFQAND